MKLFHLKYIQLSILTCLIVLSSCKVSEEQTPLNNKNNTSSNQDTTSKDTTGDNKTGDDSTTLQFPALLSAVKATMPATFFDTAASLDPSNSTNFPFSTHVRNIFFKNPDRTISNINLLNILKSFDDYTAKLNADQTALAKCLQTDGIEYAVNLPKLGAPAVAATNGRGIGLASSWTAAGSTTTMSLPHYKVFAGCRGIINNTLTAYEFIQIGKGTVGSKKIKFLHWQDYMTKAIIMVSPSDSDANKIVIDGIITVQYAYYTNNILNWDYEASGTTASRNVVLLRSTLSATNNGIFDAARPAAIMQFRADEHAGIFQMTAAGLNTGVCGAQLVANQSSYFVQGSTETLAAAPTESSGIYTLTSNCAASRSFAGSGTALNTASTNGVGKSDYTLYNAAVGGFARAPNDTFYLTPSRTLSYDAASINTFGANTGPNISIATDAQNTAADLRTLLGTSKKYGIVYLFGFGETPSPTQPASGSIPDVSDVLNRW